MTGRDPGRSAFTRVVVTAAIVVLTAGACVQTAEQATREQVLDRRRPTNFLRCDSIDAPPDTRVIGPAGGRLTSGGSEITIPANAVLEPRRITFRLADGDTAGVEVDAGGSLRFAGNRSARIQIDLSHCNSALVQERRWAVWRINRQNIDQSDELWAIITPVRAIVHVDSISSFMIAN